MAPGLRGARVTSCYYCPSPGFGPAYFRGGEIRLVCELHMGRHLDRARAGELQQERTARIRAAREEASALRAKALLIELEAVLWP